MIVNFHNEIKNIKKSGNVIEDKISSYIKKHIPSRFEIFTRSHLIYRDKVSSEFDLIIVDKFVPYKIPLSNYNLIPIEVVAGVLEIKSTLNKKTFKDAYNKLIVILNEYYLYLLVMMLEK